MTRNEANELRIKHCNLPLLEGPLYDPDNEDENVVNVLPNSKLLKVMDVGFVLPKTGFDKNIFEAYFMTSDFDQTYGFADVKCAYKPSISESMCIMSTKSKKSIFSKRKFNFIGEDIVLFGMVYRNSLYIWKEGLIKFKNGRVDKGFELSILNKNLQIESRAYYIQLGSYESDRGER
jgi:hypothetical protein